MSDQPFTIALGSWDEEAYTAELWRRKRDALTRHVANMSDAEVRALLVDVAEALDSLGGSYAGDPRDWGQYTRDAWTYGIVCGWGEDVDDENGLPLVESMGRQHGWSAANIARLRRYEAAVERATEHGLDLWPERRRLSEANDEEWMRRYPGSFGARLSALRACFICGRPGYTVPAPPDPITLADLGIEHGLTIRTGDTCPGHEYAVRRALHEHPEFTSLTGRR